jgi:DNA-directed RNA polymerase specialized sigma24 family protein
MRTTSMTSEGSVTHWVRLLKDGDRDAAQPLFEAYFKRLVALARAKLRDTNRGTTDEEDVALSAFAVFCHRAKEGRFPRLADRNDLWQVLVVLTVRKAIDAMRHERRKIRDTGRTLSLSDLEEADLEQILGAEPTPEFAALVAEELQRLLNQLGDETLRQVAVWKMEGDTNARIAAKLGCSKTTVERKLQSIRRIWDRKQGPTP